MTFCRIAGVLYTVFFCSDRTIFCSQKTGVSYSIDNRISIQETIKEIKREEAYEETINNLER